MRKVCTILLVGTIFLCSMLGHFKSETDIDSEYQKVKTFSQEEVDLLYEKIEAVEREVEELYTSIDQDISRLNKN